MIPRKNKPRTKKPTHKTDPRAVLSVKDRVRIRHRCMADDRTIRRWAAGEKVFEATAHRLEEACGELGIELLA